MLDNQLIQVFLPIIRAGLDNAGYTEVLIDQFNQPQQFGPPTGPTVYFQKLFDTPRGQVGRKDVWDSEAETMSHVELQYMETPFQISALVIQDPKSISYTASDLVNQVRAIMQSSSTIQTLEQSDVQILRVSAITNAPFTDDRDRFEFNPSFDFILVHKMITTTLQPVLQSINSGIYPVLDYPIVED